MDTKVLNYRIIVEKEKQNKGYIYVAHAPSLGISDFGKTIDEAVKNMEKALKIYIDTLIDLKKPVPTPDTEDYFVTTSKIKITSTQYQFS